MTTSDNNPGDAEYEPTPEELAGIDRGLRAAAEGRFATDQQVEAVFAKFRDALEAKRFDAAIERDATEGKLDALAEEALAEHRAGRSREL
jgi:predicted transcriptional regulator